MRFTVDLAPWDATALGHIADHLTPDGDERVPLEVALQYVLRVGLGHVLAELRKAGGSRT